MRKIIGFILIFILILTSMFVQSNMLNKVEIFGIRPNLLLVIVVTISLWYGLYVGSIFGAIFGLIADSWFSLNFGKYIIMFTLISILVGYFNKNYKKENIITLVYLVFNVTIIFELLIAIKSVIVNKEMFNLFVLLKVQIVSLAFNILLACVMYYILAYVCNKIEDLIAEDRW